jgi:hypothetical protein
MVKRYGQPVAMKEFSDKMQLMNATGYQGIFEAAGHKLNDIGGIMLWKLNAAFPSVIWQVYDWYLVPNAGYYFMQNACEPVHIQLNTKDLNIEYINRTYKPIKSLTAHIEIFDTDSKSLFTTTEKIDLAAPEAKEGLSVADVINKNPGISFVVLNLKSADGKTVSHNVYWISPKNDFTKINSLSVSKLTAQVNVSASFKNEKRWNLQLTNNSGKIAFFINPRLMSGNEEIAPSFWSANYFTLAPGEPIDVTVGCPPEAIKEGTPYILLEGWNVETLKVPLN